MAADEQCWKQSAGQHAGCPLAALPQPQHSAGPGLPRVPVGRGLRWLIGFSQLNPMDPDHLTHSTVSAPVILLTADLLLQAVTEDHSGILIEIILCIKIYYAFKAVWRCRAIIRIAAISEILQTSYLWVHLEAWWLDKYVSSAPSEWPARCWPRRGVRQHGAVWSPRAALAEHRDPGLQSEPTVSHEHCSVQYFL